MTWAGRIRSGLGAGFRSCDCWGLPSWRLHLPNEEEMALRHLSLAGAVVYDIGANIGIFSLFFARQVGVSGSVIAFEPVPENFTKLELNLRLNRVVNVQPLRLALGAAAGQRAAYAAAGQRGTTSIVSSGGGDPTVRPVGTLPVDTLDAVAATRGLSQPDLLKIDVEGAELEVLRGGEAMLALSRPRIFLELHGDGPDQKSAQAADLLALLDRHDYRIVHVETAARVTPGGFCPGVGHWLCTLA